MITLSHMITKHITFRLGMYYLLMQLLGAFFGVALTKMLIPNDLKHAIIEKSIIGFYKADDWNLAVIGWEALGSMVWVFGFFLLYWQRKFPQSIFCLGTALIFGILTASFYHLSGAGFNLFRVCALFILNGSFKGLPLYIAGDVFGGLIGGILGGFLMKDNKTNSRAINME